MDAGTQGKTIVYRTIAIWEQRSYCTNEQRVGYNATEDNGDDAGSKLSRKGNVGAGVGAKRGVHDNTPLPRVVPSRPSLLVERARGLGVSGMEFLHDSWCVS